MKTLKMRDCHDPKMYRKRTWMPRKLMLMSSKSLNKSVKKTPILIVKWVWENNKNIPP